MARLVPGSPNMKIRTLLRGALPLLCVVASTSLAQTFTHPGISHSQADLDRMKNNINVEPYKSAYAEFSNEGYSQSTNTGQGPFTSETYGHGQFEMRNDAQVAHQNAVMWYVTGNSAYLNNAIKIMMGWANTLTSFDQTDYLTAGTAMNDFCDAGEIIRATGNGTWSSANITTFQNWLLTYLYPPLLSPGNSISANVLQAAGAGGLQMAGLLSCGIFCDRRDIFNFAVSSLQHNAAYSYGLTEYIDTSAQNYENQRDIGHASGNLGTFAQSFYKAYNQGQDLFSLSNNLLASAFESQAKFDLGWDVAPVVWTAKDGSFHSKMSGDNRTAFDNLESDLAYHIYHDIKGLNMPYTKMSRDLKFPHCVSNGGSFYNIVDSTGQVPVVPLVGEPAETAVRLYEDYLSGSYITNFQPGNYTYAALKAGGMLANGSGPVSSMRVPIGWTVTAYDADNFTGNSVVVTGTLQNMGVQNMGDINFNDKLTSMKVTGGGTWPIFNTTYKLVNRNSGKIAEVTGSSTADGGSVAQNTYASGLNQLWRVEATGSSQFKLLNINSGKAFEVAGASLSNGSSSPGVAGDVDQATYVPPPNLATGGTASASAAPAGAAASQAFDGNNGTKWYSGDSVPTGWLQYQLASAKALNQYTLTSANDVPQRDPATWQFQGSNNGATWTNLDTQSAQVFVNRAQTNIYNFTNTTAYIYYRLNVTANNGGSSYGIQLAEMAFYSSQTGGVHQRWTITPVSGAAYGTYLKFLNVNSGKALDVYGNSTADGANIEQWTSNGGNNQQWSLQIP